ncbi:hypothetical protein TL16_g10696 [Triparma laevis f. inornata]|uniref:Uncharacterized protein n=1 Tax=Triparma laevis f. inornata TaxID=1714386 RepID=A0A9W7ER56_9STRA|nr:hypothetical protein TL16_g10696 [Triparma laevis f. inornata]
MSKRSGPAPFNPYATKLQRPNPSNPPVQQKSHRSTSSSSSLPTLLNKYLSSSAPSNPSVVYVTLGMEEASGVPKRLKDIALGVVDKAIDNVGLEEIVRRYNRNPSTTSKITSGVVKADVVEEIVSEAVLKKFMLKKLENTEEFEEALEIGNNSLQNNPNGEKLLEFFAQLSAKNMPCALLCLDSIAGIYRKSFDDSQTQNTRFPVETFFRISAFLRNLDMPVLVANQSVANMGGGQNGQKECFGLSYQFCVDGRLELERRQGEKWIRKLKVKCFSNIKDVTMRFEVGTEGMTEVIEG